MKFSTKKSGSVTLLHIKGKILSQTDAAPLLDEASALVESGHNRIVLDLSETTFLNSEGLNVLLKILTLCRRAGGDCVLCCISEELNRLFIITKLSHIFTITDSLAAAEEKLKPMPA